jgi:Listeria-Bacteroides repeat domain (List_Bact_rpt)
MASFAVTYNGNGSTGGAVPVDGNSPYATGATVTVLGNTGSLIKTGATFIDWGTSATGGTQYQPAQTFIMGGAAITLYAQWTVDGTALPYDPSGVDPQGNEISTLAFFGGNVSGILISANGEYPVMRSYWMRGHNATTGLYVTWQAPMIDYGAMYAPAQGSGTITDIVWLGFTQKGL